MTSALLDAARDLRSEIDARAAKSEGGPIDAETVAALYDAGLYAAMIPAAVGGAELDITACIEIFAEVARADGSVGWCLMASQSAASYFAAFCDDALVDRVFGSGIPLVAGQFAPNGTLRPTGESDWVLDGSYRFGSGLDAAQWAGAGAITEPRNGEDPSYRFVIMERSEVELQGGWDVMGLQSTASWDYRANGVRVPDNATFDFFFPHRYRGGTMYDMGVLPLTAAGHAGWAIGLVRRALDELRVMATTKKRMASRSPMRDSEWIQMRLGHLEARAAAATAWTFQSFQALEARCACGGGPDEALVRDARMATAFVNHEGADIIRDAYTLAGTEALRDGGLQRAFRDIHAGTQHAVVSESVTQDYGAASIASAPERAVDA